MTQSAHTPGPWQIEVLTDSNIVKYMMKDTQGGEDFDEAAANASLMNAAPDLLAVLKRIMNAHNSGNNGAYMGEATVCPAFASQANAAIARAEGGAA